MLCVSNKENSSQKNEDNKEDNAQIIELYEFENINDDEKNNINYEIKDDVILNNKEPLE